MFKKIVELIVNIETQEDFDIVCGMIDTEFNKEKLTWKEHELLYSLMNMVTI